MTWTKHHIIYPVLGVVLLLVFFAWLHAHDAWKNMEGDLKADAVKIKQNNEVGKTADASIAKSTTVIAQTDTDTKRKLAALQTQLDKKLDTAQAKEVVQGLLPGVKTVEAQDAEGHKVIAVADTQENRDVINKASVDFKACIYNRDDCQTKQKEFMNVIAQDNLKIGELTSTNDTLSKENKKLKSYGMGGNFMKRTLRVAVPIGCAAGGAFLASRFKSGNQQGNAAATGAMIGGAGCAITFHF